MTTKDQLKKGSEAWSKHKDYWEHYSEEVKAAAFSGVIEAATLAERKLCTEIVKALFKKSRLNKCGSCDGFSVDEGSITCTSCGHECFPQTFDGLGYRIIKAIEREEV